MEPEPSSPAPQARFAAAQLPALAYKPLSRTVADWLAARIIRGELLPGARLQEPRLAEEAGVSRSPVREALRLLAREGLVELVPRIGAQVAAVDATDAAHLYTCRLLIEPPCIADAVSRLEPEDLERLAHCRAGMERGVSGVDHEVFLAHNQEYNRHLTSRCANPVMRELVEVTWNKAIRYWSLLVRFAHYTELSLERHARLHEAVLAREPLAAADADREILTSALAQLTGGFGHNLSEQGGLSTTP